MASAVWAVAKEPQFLPDDVDGRVLFDAASAKYHAMREGIAFSASQYNIGNIVMLPSVKEARARGVLNARLTFKELYEDGVIWPDGKREQFEAVIWCAGFGYATIHLKELNILNDDGKVDCEGTRAMKTDGLWLVGYGSFTGFASATLIGVGRSARQTVNEIILYLK